MTYWNEVERSLRFWQTEDRLHSIVVKGADGHSAQAERDGLKQQVLGGVTGLEVHIPFGTRSILARGARIDGGDGEYGRGLADRVLL
jgi:hypothetical protein